MDSSYDMILRICPEEPEILVEQRVKNGYTVPLLLMLPSTQNAVPSPNPSVHPSAAARAMV